jgi:hypothetical protein
MARIETTKEYQANKEALRIQGGKPGQIKYDKACAAESEARQGRIRTLQRTDNGEKRVPDAEKYKLSDGHRLLIQRLEDNPPGYAFLFIGSHDEMERWLDNHPGYRWSQGRASRHPPSSISPSEEEKERHLEELKRREDEIRRLNAKLVQQEIAFEGLVAESMQIDGNEKRMHVQLEQVELERQALAAQHQKLSTEAHAIDAQKQQSAARLAEQERELKNKEMKIDEERKLLAASREQVNAAKQQLHNEKEISQRDIKARTLRVNEFAVLVSQREKEVENLKEAAKQPALTTKRSVWKKPLIWGSAILVMCLFGSILFAVAGPRSYSTPERTKSNVTENSGPNATSDKARVAPVDEPKPNPPERPKVEAAAETKPTAPAATERQMSYLKALVQRKGWSEKERDADILKTLGYARTYANVTKQEASKLIDAWKESK